MNSGICETGRITDNHSNKCLHGVAGHYWTKVKLDALGKHVHAYICICKRGEETMEGAGIGGTDGRIRIQASSSSLLLKSESSSWSVGERRCLGDE